jgi:hypothetical protein
MAMLLSSVFMIGLILNDNVYSSGSSDSENLFVEVFTDKNEYKLNETVDLQLNLTSKKVSSEIDDNNITVQIYNLFEEQIMTIKNNNFTSLKITGATSIEIWKGTWNLTDNKGKVVVPGRFMILAYLNYDHGPGGVGYASGKNSIIVYEQHRNNNTSPISIITTPNNHETFNRSDKIELNGSKSYDPDGDRILLTWYIDGIEYCNEYNFYKTFQTTGWKNITLFVIDSYGYNSSKQIDIRINNISTIIPYNNTIYSTKVINDGLIFEQRINKTWISSDSPILFEASLINTNGYDVNISQLEPGWGHLNFLFQISNSSKWNGPGDNWDSLSSLLRLKPSESKIFRSTMTLINNTIGMDLKRAYFNVSFTVESNYYYIQSFYNSRKFHTELDSNGDGFDDVRYFWDGNITAPPLKFWIVGNEVKPIKDQSPIVDMEIKPIIGNITTNFEFKAIAFDPDGQIISWDWDFGDNNYATIENTSHTYRRKGSYQIILRVVDNNYNFNISVKNISVNNMLPIINLQIPSTAYINSKVILNASKSSDIDGQITTVKWNIDDYTTTGLITYYRFKTIGLHPIRVAIEDDDSGVSEKETQIMIIETDTNNNSIWISAILPIILIFAVVLTIIAIRRR